MNVPADVLFDLATAAGAPKTLRAEGVVRHAADRLRELKKRPDPEQLRLAAERALRALTDPNDHQYHEAVAMLAAALKGAA